MSQQIRKKFPEASIEYIYHSFKEVSPIPFHDSKTKHHTDLLLFKKDIPDALKYLCSRAFGFNPLKKGTLNKNVKLIKEADAVIVSPCGANIGIYQDWIFLLRVLIAVLEGKKPIFHLNTIGKSKNVLFNFIAKYVLKRSKLYVRENKSKLELNSWGLKPEHGVDTAFSLKEDPELINVQFSDSEDKSYIAFIPTRFDNWHVHYRNNSIDTKLMDTIIPEIVKVAKTNNLGIKIIPHLTGSLDESDFLKTYKDEFIKQGLDKNEISVVKEVKTLFDYEQVIKHAKFAVSMRYHGVIFAIKKMVPFLSLSYENKMSEACTYSGMLDYEIKISEANSDDVARKLDGLLKNDSVIRESLASRLNVLKKLSSLPIQGLYLESLFKDKK
ncbi:hypothetical protein JCM9157_2079 [Halalkalibacter akibai JCM 9157]|uniref:Polysaccharide pyruvyl transferase domain-containing protein n=2 Tax=Halalkalibacter akibai TaxID=1411 RepID=W4QSA7_HALA3|nr:hypothetical protein JCM9157_2079 [Halalkalibacter akibai JCM 9157]